jgi:hypothetical protein
VDCFLIHRRIRHGEATMTLNNFTSKTEVDVWEVDYYDTDWQGRKFSKPQLGIRVNEGVWLELRAFLEYAALRQKELK